MIPYEPGLSRSWSSLSASDSEVLESSELSRGEPLAGLCSKMIFARKIRAMVRHGAISKTSTDIIQIEVESGNHFSAIVVAKLSGTQMTKGTMSGISTGSVRSRTQGKVLLRRLKKVSQGLRVCLREARQSG